MPDIEKVIKGLEEWINDVYALDTKIDACLVADALELLKEQQPKKGKWQPYKHGDDTWHQCSACGVADRYIEIVKREGYPDYRMVSKKNFCPNCGADMRKDGDQ